MRNTLLLAYVATVAAADGQTMLTAPGWTLLGVALGVSAAGAVVAMGAAHVL